MQVELKETESIYDKRTEERKTKMTKQSFFFFNVTLSFNTIACNCFLFFGFFCFLFLFFNNIYLVTTLLMTILTFTWTKNKNNVQEIKEKYNVTAFTTN